MERREFIGLLGGSPPRLLHWPHEKTDWEKNHARDRSCFAQYRNDGFAAHRAANNAAPPTIPIVLSFFMIVPSR